MIACPGGDFCALANARSIPIAEAITERFDDLDELYDIGDIDLHISGCINSCGHHHSGHIGILGVDKDGKRVVPGHARRLRRLDAVAARRVPGKVIGPSFAADEVPDVIEARDRHLPRRSAHAERDASSTPCARVGIEPFKARGQRGAPQHGRAEARPETRTTMRFIDRRARPVAAAVRRRLTPAKADLLLTLEQWPAVRGDWPRDSQSA